MKLVIQRVKNAKVKAGREVVGQINSGLLILFGVGQEDSPDQTKVLAEKVTNMRLMPDLKDKMNLSIKESGGEILVVSQFTLYADTSGGRRPSFVKAAPPELAREVYEKFTEALRAEDLKVETGSFGNYMGVEAELDGPVTIVLDHPAK